MFALIFSTAMFAQQEYSELLQPKPVTSFLSLSSTSLERLATMRTNNAFLEITPVYASDIEELQQDGKLPIQLPGLNTPVYFTTTQVEQKTNGDFDWYGEDDEGTGGWASLKKRDGLLFGSLTYDGRNFRLRNLEPGFPVLIELKKVNQNYDHCSSTKGDLSVKPPTSDYDKDNCAPLRIIRILTLYSSAADALTGLNPVTEAADMIGNSNIALINSGLNDVRFEGAGVQLYNGFTETNTGNGGDDIEDDLEDLTDDLNNAATVIAGFRDDFNADLVVLFVNGNYIIPGVGQVLGIAGLDPIVLTNAYAIVEIDAGDNTVFTHEVGHNLGCRHNGATNTDPLIGAFANAHLFTAGGTNFKTVVANGGSLGTAILNFSNPNINFNGAATGVNNDRDNARQIDENTACLVSCYELGGDPINVFISGLNMTNENQTSSWCANVSDCDNITNFNWAYSTDGFNFTNFFGGSCATFTTPSGVSQFFLRVVVTCSNGEMAEDVHRVTVQAGNGGGGPQPISPGTFVPADFMGQVSPVDPFSFTVFPNPVSGNQISLNIRSVESHKEAHFVLRSMAGKQIAVETTQDLIKGSKDYFFPIQKALSGVYIMQVYTNSGISFSRKIIIK